MLYYLQEYMLGDKNQSVLPVAFSLMASFVSAISMFGLSAEMFSRGTQFSVINISYILATPVIGYVYLPVFFKLGNLSLYQVHQRHSISYFVQALYLLVCPKFLFNFIFFIVFRNTIRSFDPGRHVISVQRANGVLHGDRAVRPGVDVGSRDGITSERVNRTRRCGVCVLFLVGRN